MAFAEYPVAQLHTDKNIDTEQLKMTSYLATLKNYNQSNNVSGEQQILHYQKCGHRIVCSIRVFKIDFHVIKLSHCSLFLKY